VVGGVSLIVGSSFSAGQYYRTVGEVVAAGEEHVGETFRLAGTVEEGTLRAAPTSNGEARFRLTDGTGARLAVAYSRALPDSFVEGVDVVAEGRQVAPDRFEASLVVAKCPSKYEGRLSPEEVAQREVEARGQR